MFGFQSLKLFSSLSQTSCSVSRILPWKASVNAVTQVFFASVCSYWNIANKLHDTSCLDIWALQWHCTANCLMAAFFFFFFTETVIFQTHRMNGRSSTWLSCCSLFFLQHRVWRGFLDSGFHASFLSATLSSNIWTCIFLTSLLKKEHFLLLNFWIQKITRKH